jgi:hypothetical protein
MNTTDRLQQQFDASNKSHKGKIINGKKKRATKQYFKDEAALARRKQDKVRYDTFRREEQPEAEDMWLEDLHFANFLGLSKCEWGKGNILMTYNGGTYSDEYNIDTPVNITECDKYLKLEQRIREEEEQMKKEKSYRGGKCNCQGYCELDHTMLCYCYLVDGVCRDGDNCSWLHVPFEDELPKYLALYNEENEENEDGRSRELVPVLTNWKEYHTKWPATEWVDNLKFCEELNKKEQQLFVEQNPDVGRFTVECLMSKKA